MIDIVTVIVEVVDVIVHPSYDHENTLNDIALLKIADVEFDDFIRPVCLPAETDGKDKDYSSLNGTKDNDDDDEDDDDDDDDDEEDDYVLTSSNVRMRLIETEEFLCGAR